MSALIGRTAEFDAINAGLTNDGKTIIPKPLMQLVWHYKQQYWWDYNEAMGTIVGDGKGLLPYYFFEMVADFGYGNIKEQCDPYGYFSQTCDTATATNGSAFAERVPYPSASQITNDIIIDLMLSDTISLIAYNRLQPTLGKDGVLTFQDNSSRHKIAVAGFQPGPYPLLLNDVGDGSRRYARISTNLREMYLTNDGSQPPIHFDPKSPFSEGSPFLMYEDYDKLANPITPIYFIEHHDRLRLHTTDVPNIDMGILVSATLLILLVYIQLQSPAQGLAPIRVH